MMYCIWFRARAAGLFQWVSDCGKSFTIIGKLPKFCPACGKEVIHA